MTGDYGTVHPSTDWARIAGKAMGRSVDAEANHHLHAFTCEVCQRMATENVEMVVRISKLRRKVRKWKRRAQRAEAELKRDAYWVQKSPAD